MTESENFTADSRNNLTNLLNKALVISEQDPSLKDITNQLNALLLRLNPSEAQKIITKWIDIIRTSDKNGFACPEGVEHWLIDIHSGEVNKGPTALSYNRSKILTPINNSFKHKLDIGPSRLMAVGPPNTENVAEVYYGIPIVYGRSGRPGRGPFLLMHLPNEIAENLLTDVKNMPALMEQVVAGLLVVTDATGKRMSDVMKDNKKAASLKAFRLPTLDDSTVQQVIRSTEVLEIS